MVRAMALRNSTPEEVNFYSAQSCCQFYFTHRETTFYFDHPGMFGLLLKVVENHIQQSKKGISNLPEDAINSLYLQQITHSFRDPSKARSDFALQSIMTSPWAEKIEYYLKAAQSDTITRTRTLELTLHVVLHCFPIDCGMTSPTRGNGRPGLRVFSFQKPYNRRSSMPTRCVGVDGRGIWDLLHYISH